MENKSSILKFIRTGLFSVASLFNFPIFALFVSTFGFFQFGKYDLNEIISEYLGDPDSDFFSLFNTEADLLDFDKIKTAALVSVIILSAAFLITLVSAFVNALCSGFISSIISIVGSILVIAVDSAIEIAFKSVINDSAVMSIIGIFSPNDYKLSVGFGYFVCVILLLAAAFIAIIDLTAKKDDDETQDHQYYDNSQDGGVAISETVELRETDIKTSDLFSGCIIMLTGEYLGCSINLHFGEQIVMGKDPFQCNLVIDNYKNYVSRKHCSISYDENVRKYVVVDYSTNGVYLNEIKRIPQNVDVYVDPGTVVSLAKSVSFKLK